MGDTLRKRTLMVHGSARRSQYGEVSEAMFLTQGFVYETAEDAEQRFIKSFENEFIYARYGNPTVAIFEKRIALLEGAEAAFATASGMAAVHGALSSVLKAGDHVVAARTLFGSCLFVLEEVLTKFGVDVTFVDGTDLAAWQNAVCDATKVFFFETVSNPTLEIIDVAAVCEIAHAFGAMVIVDNVFATPVFSNAFQNGVDVVVYSATIHIDGQGRVLGGVVLSTEDFIKRTLEPFMKHTGGAMSAFNAWVMLKGLETIELRVKAQAASALCITEALQGHERLERVIYPGHQSHPQHALVSSQMSGGGTVLAIDITGGKEVAFAFLNKINIGLISNNLGDAKSIFTHPATTTHQRLNDARKIDLGITPGLIRLSVGLEDADDLVRDILEALR